MVEEMEAAWESNDPRWSMPGCTGLQQTALSIPEDISGADTRTRHVQKEQEGTSGTHQRCVRGPERSRVNRSGDKLILHTEASMLGLGAVLSVEREGEELPVAYFSKRLTATEKNYSASELECLAVVKAVDNYATHLLGQEFTVITDYRPLMALSESHRLNSRLMRWACPGIHHQNTDGLSWQSLPEDDDSLLGETGIPPTT